MKLTKTQLKRIIKEELGILGEEVDGPTVTVELTQPEANGILIALEGLMGDPDRGRDPSLNSAYDKIFDAGIAGGFGQQQEY